MNSGYQPLPSGKPRGNPPIVTLEEQRDKKLKANYDIERYREILESIANNIHADNMARVEACKVLMEII